MSRSIAKIMQSCKVCWHGCWIKAACSEAGAGLQASKTEKHYLAQDAAHKYVKSACHRFCEGWAMGLQEPYLRS